jgi:ApeA N-terminal domain 1
VAGTLRFSASGLRLKLLGGFQGGWSPDVQRYEMIQGVVGDSPYGVFVTLYDNIQENKSIKSQGIGSETIVCTRAYVGDDYLLENATGIASFAFTTSYLYDWARIKGVNDIQWNPPSWKEVDLRYSSSEPTRFEIGDTVALVGFSYTSHGASRVASIRVKASISVTPRSSVAPNEINGKIQSFCDLLTFATDRPNAVQEVSLDDRRDIGVSKRYHLLYDRIFRVKGEKGPLFESDMLFSLRESLDAGLNLFQRWLEFTKKHGAFCTIYFANLYAQPPYLDEKFQLLISAFTLLCESLFERSQHASRFVEDTDRALACHFSDREREILGHVLPSVSQVETTLHIRRLLEEHGRLMGQIIGDFDEFVKAVSDTLRFIETRDERQERPYLEGGNLYYAMERIRVLIKILVLRELGFDEGRVVSFIERSKSFFHLKALRENP